MARWRSTGGILLGALLIFHGLANSVLPLRGVDVAGPGQGMPVIALLYIMAIIGFTAAGLGVLGVRPVNRVVMPAVWIAALAAPAAQLRAPYGDLWVGIALSAVLPILTTLFVVTTPASRATNRSRRGRAPAQSSGCSVSRGSALPRPYGRGPGRGARRRWNGR